MRGCPGWRCARNSGLKVIRTSCGRSNPCRKRQALSTLTLQDECASGVISPRHEALTLLHKITKALPAALDQKGLSQSVRPRAIWERILSQAHEDLSAIDERPVKVAGALLYFTRRGLLTITLTVLGLDQWSSSRELVTALLAEPLSSNKTLLETLTQRWATPDQTEIRIVYVIPNYCEPQNLLASYDRHEPVLRVDSASLALPSTFLSQFSVPVELIELRPSINQTSQSVSISEILDQPSLLQADILILLFNPLATPLSSIPISQLPSNTILIVNSATPQSDVDALLENQKSRVQSKRYSTATSIRILAADPKRAVQAVHMLQEESNSITSIQRYQDNINGSQLSSITRALNEKLTQCDSSPPAATIRTKLALDRLRDVLLASRWSLLCAHDNLHQVYVEASRLQERVEETTAKTQRDVFESPSSSQKTPRNEVQVAVQQATTEMMHIMQGLSWWKVIARVDEITSIVTRAVHGVWCRALEKKVNILTSQFRISHWFFRSFYKRVNSQLSKKASRSQVSNSLRGIQLYILLFYKTTFYNFRHHLLTISPQTISQDRYTLAAIKSLNSRPVVCTSQHKRL